MSEITLAVRNTDNGSSSSVPRKYSLSQQQPLYLQADKDTVFQLADENGRLPKDVLFSREGEDLLIHPAGQDKASAVIKDYYAYHSSPPQALYLPQESLPAADYPSRSKLLLSPRLLILKLPILFSFQCLPRAVLSCLPA